MVEVGFDTPEFPPETTKLHEAIRVGDLLQVRELIDEGNDVNQITLYGEVPLDMALELGQLEIAQLLLDSGADVDFGCSYSPIDSAAGNGHTEFVAKLIAAGANVNAFGEGDHTPLMSAVLGGNPNIVELLIASGADVNAWSQGESVVYKAVFNGNLEIVKLLVEAGADISNVDDQRNSAIYIAAREKHIDIVEFLIPLVSEEEQKQIQEKLSKNPY